MGNTITQFAALMDKTGGFGGDVTTDVTGKRKLFKEFL
jgi:hypothetical protein